MAKVVCMEEARATKSEMDAVRHVLRRAFCALPVRSPKTAFAEYGKAVNIDVRLSASDPAKLHHAKETRRPAFSRELITPDDYGWGWVIREVSQLPEPHFSWVRTRYMDPGPTQREYREACQAAFMRCMIAEHSMKPRTKPVVKQLIKDLLTHCHRPSIIHNWEPWPEISVISDKGRRPMTKDEWNRHYSKYWRDIKRLASTVDRQSIVMLKAQGILNK